MKAFIVLMLFAVPLLGDYLDTNHNGIYEVGEVDPSIGYREGACLCPVTRFVPVHYTEKKCVQEPYLVNRRCCRYICKPCDCCKGSICCHMKRIPEYYNISEMHYHTREVYELKTYFQPHTRLEEETAYSVSAPTFSPEAKEDRIIYTSIMGKLFSQKFLDNKERVNVSVKEGNVQILGSVILPSQKVKVGKLVESIQGVKKVDNQLQVMRPDLTEEKSP